MRGLANVRRVAGEAKGRFDLVLTGCRSSVPIVVWGSTLGRKLGERCAIIIYIGAGVLAYTAAHMIVSEPLRVLEGSSDSLPVLVRLLASACAGWSNPVSLGEWWDRPGVAFHTVLVTRAGDDAQVRNRWEAAGASLSDLPS